MVLRRTCTAFILCVAIWSLGCGEHERASELGTDFPLSAEDHERAHEAVAMLRAGEIEAGLGLLRTITSARPHRGRSVEWLPDAVEALLGHGEFVRIDSLLALVGPLELRPPELQLLSGRMLVMRGDERGAFRAFEACYDDPGVGNRSLFRAAALHSARGRHEEAAGLARRSLDMETHNDAVRLLLCSALIELELLDEALEISLLLQDPGIHATTVAQVHLEAGRPEDALAALEVIEAPGTALRRYQLGWALLELGRFTEAKTVLASVMAFKDAPLLLARCHRELGEFEEAELLEELERQDSSRARARRLQQDANRAAGQGKLIEAHRLLRQAVGIEPADARLRNDLAAVLTRMDRYEDAEKQFLEAARLAPTDAAIPGNLAQLYLLMGEPERANDQASRRQEILDAQ